MATAHDASPILDPLVHDLVAWCAAAPRRYAEVMEAWRTSCPRLTVWEEAVARGLLETRPGPGGLEVVVTARGRCVCAAAMAARSTQPSAPLAAAVR